MPTRVPGPSRLAWSWSGSGLVLARPAWCNPLRRCTVRNGYSRYTKFHDGLHDFTGKRLPFGCKVIYKPSETSGRLKPKKWGPQSSTGIFVGYELKPGYEFNGTYRVYDMTDFAKMSLHVAAPASSFLHTYQLVKTIEIPEDGITFPLRAEYERQHH